MPAWLHPNRDERAASAFLDAASALDAGLPPASFGGDPTDGEAVLLRAMERRGIALDPTDAAVLTAAWRAGVGPATLRRCAEQREQRASFGRTVLASCRYPALLLLLATLVSFVAAQLGATWLPWAMLGFLGLAALATWLLVRFARSSSPRALALPGIGPLVRDLAELPYLEVLRSLYAAGVPLRQAHTQAVDAAPPSPLRERLRLADRHVQDGRPVHEALASTLAIDAETLSILVVGEKSGTLEDALDRAVRRRRDTALRSSTTLAKLVANGAYAIGVLAAVTVIVTYYASYANLLRSVR